MSKTLYPDQSFWTIIIITVVCGLAAGVLGAASSRVYFLPDYLPNDVDLSNLNHQGSGLVIRDPKNVYVSSDVKILETVDNLQPVLVGVFKKLDDNQVNGYYSLDNPLFTGLTITADGWIVAQPPVKLKADFVSEHYVVITSDRRLYNIEQVSTLTDLPGNPLVFRLANASNLPVKKILSRSDLSLGQSLLVMTGRQTVWPSTLSSVSRGQGVLNSDSLAASLILSGAESDIWRNAFVFDMAGNLAAIISDDQTIVPAFYYSSLLSDLTQAEKKSQPQLGINYLDLSSVRLPELSLDKGALIYGNTTHPAIIKGGPAEKAGLQAGDVISWVNNQEISSEKDLADLVANYRSGDRLILTYLRDGVEKTVEVILGENK